MKNFLDRWIRVVLDGINQLSFGWSLFYGLLLGGVVGLVALQEGSEGLLAALILCGFAIVVGWTAQPIWVEDPVEESEPVVLFEMVKIPAGTFLMGSPKGELGRSMNERQHLVTLNTFQMTATTVTRQQYQDIMVLFEAPGPGGSEHPVTNISWLDAVKFCNRASRAAGFEPCYKIKRDTIRWKLFADGYRLPTEAEWEFAARADSSTRWSYGDDEKELGEYAWFKANSGNQSHPVGQLKPNAWGLYDMHGNVWEWCWDVFDEYPQLAVQNPRSSDRARGARVLRGGGYSFESKNLRSAERSRSFLWKHDVDVGFRCVRSVPNQPRRLSISFFRRSAISRR